MLESMAVIYFMQAIKVKTVEIEYVKEFLHNFAKSIGCEFGIGTVGFGRHCVGILEPHIGHYVDINPVNYEDEWEESYPVGFSYNLQPKYDVTPNFYHKHSCMAVLAVGEDYDTATIELYKWVSGILAGGSVETVKYNEVDVSNLSELEALFSTPYKVALVYSTQDRI